MAENTVDASALDLVATDSERRWITFDAGDGNGAVRYRLCNRDDLSYESQIIIGRMGTEVEAFTDEERLAQLTDEQIKQTCDRLRDCVRRALYDPMPDAVFDLLTDQQRFAILEVFGDGQNTTEDEVLPDATTTSSPTPSHGFATTTTSIPSES